MHERKHSWAAPVREYDILIDVYSMSVNHPACQSMVIKMKTKKELQIDIDLRGAFMADIIVSSTRCSCKREQNLLVRLI